MAKKKKINHKRRLAVAAGLAVASFTFNSQLDSIVRADDVTEASQDARLVLEEGKSLTVDVQALEPATPVTEASPAPVVENTPVTVPEAVDPAAGPALEETHYPGDGHDHDHDHEHDHDHDHNHDEDKYALLSPEERAIAEALDEDLLRHFTDENGNPSPTVDGKPTVAPLTAADATEEWTLKGLGNYTFATVRYNNQSGTLSIEASGQPHAYFNNNQYGRLTVNRNGVDLFDKAFLGAERYSNFKDSGILREGDQVTVFHAEPNRMTVSNDYLKETGQTPKEFIYEVNPDLTLKNVTDLRLMERHLAALFVDQSKKGLSFGITEANIADLEKKIADSKMVLTDEDRVRLGAIAAEARALLNAIPWDIPVNQVMTKTITVLPSTVIAGTEREGRPVGTKHDRQDLGMILQTGSEIRVRQTNPDYTGGLTLRLFGDDGKIENHVDFRGDWVSLKALGNVAAFVDTPVNDAGIKPVVEYEIVGGAAKTLPTFTYGDNQAEFIAKWDSTKAPYALLKSNNMHVLLPILDMPLANSKDLAQVVRDYDEKAFAVIDRLTGVPSNTADNHIKGIYFAKANKNGVGAAYYTRTHTAQNAASVGAYLDLGWLTIHEIAHGYEVPSSTMPIIDVFNNMYGAVFQGIYMDNPERDSWVYGGDKPGVMNRLVAHFADKGQPYGAEGVGYKDKLNALLDLVTLRGEEGFTKFNIYHREQALAGRDIRDLGSLWTEFFAKEYQLDITPFFDGIQVPLRDVVKTNNYRSYITPVAMLAQVVPADRLDQALVDLGWDKEFLRTKISLITTDELAKLGLKSQVTLSITNPEEAMGTQLSIMNGDKVVKTVTITDGIIDLGELPNGVYTFKHDNPKANIVEPYLYVRESGHQTRTINLDNILPAIKNLYTNTDYVALQGPVKLSDIEALKTQLDEITDPVVRQENQDLIDKAYTLINQWDLKGLGNILFANLRYLNNDKVFRVDTLGGQPHGYIADQYAKIEIVSPTGQELYSKTYFGSKHEVKGTEEVPMVTGTRITITHREPGRLLAYPEHLKEPATGVTSYTYEVMPSGRLRLVGDNKEPELIIERDNVVIEVGDSLDLTSLAKAYDADDGDLTITAANIQTDLDNTKLGDYLVTYTVTDADGASASKSLTVRVVPSTKALGQDQTVDKNAVVDPRLSIANADSLPTSAHYAFKDSINTSVPGVVQAIVVVTLEDARVQEIPVTITVRSDADMFVPVTQDLTTVYGQPLDAQTGISNFDSLPAGSQVVWGSGLDLNQLGQQTVDVTVIYPDGSQETLSLAVTVNDLASQYSLTAKDQKVEFGAPAIAENSVAVTPDLPSDAQVTWLQAPQTTTAGQQNGVVRVTFADGSFLDLPVVVVVEPEPVVVPIEVPKEETTPVRVEVAITPEQPVVIDLTPPASDNVPTPPVTVPISVAPADTPPITTPVTTVVTPDDTGQLVSDKILVPTGTTTVDVVIMPAKPVVTPEVETVTVIEVTVNPKTDDDKTRVDIVFVEKEKPYVPVTVFVDENGQELRLAMEGSHTDVVIDGYQQAYYLTDGKGNVKVVYHKVLAPTLPVRPSQPTVPVAPTVPNQPTAPTSPVDEEKIEQNGLGETADPKPEFPVDQVPVHQNGEGTTADPKPEFPVDQVPVHQNGEGTTADPKPEFPIDQVPVHQNGEGTTADPKPEFPIDQVPVHQNGKGTTAEPKPVFPLDQVPGQEKSAVGQAKQPLVAQQGLSLTVAKSWTPEPGQPAADKAQGTASLPNTGEATTALSAYGLGLSLSALAAMALRRRKED